ncbi:MAG: hypothetical protein K2N41_01400 [Lachnospiraceae bacterium]|nr:hypothetical protein [Lachnospiraceae bacterium]MDE7238351.1 hypothetical protein [Lachnospiraceae bacterium]
MRFCDLFISYKAGLKGIRSMIPFVKLPLYRKIAAIVTFTFVMIIVILFMFKLHVIAFTVITIGLVLLVVFRRIDSKKNNLEIMLKEHYVPYSQKRMSMVISILEKYNIDINDTDTIDLLMQEARRAQIQNDYLATLKTPVKTLSAIIIPIVAYTVQKLSDNFTNNEIFALAVFAIIIIIMIFSIVLALKEIVRDMIYPDYNVYNDFISDMAQLKIFYSKNDLFIK